MTWLSGGRPNESSHNLNRLLDKPGSETLVLYENSFLNFTGSISVKLEFPCVSLPLR